MATSGWLLARMTEKLNLASINPSGVTNPSHAGGLTRTRCPACSRRVSVHTEVSNLNMCFWLRIANWLNTVTCFCRVASYDSWKNKIKNWSQIQQRMFTMIMWPCFCSMFWAQTMYKIERVTSKCAIDQLQICEYIIMTITLKCLFSTIAR